MQRLPDAGFMLDALTLGTAAAIERQESAGQGMVVRSDRIPADHGKMTREQLEALGFTIIGPDENPLFLKATLPPGWVKQATDRAMHSTINDEKGRVRFRIFYKAAFYDERAYMYARLRFDVGCRPKDGTEVYMVTDGGEVFIDDLPDYDAAEAWLGGNRPDWRNPLAYWD